MEEGGRGEESMAERKGGGCKCASKHLLRDYQETSFHQIPAAPHALMVILQLCCSSHLSLLLFTHLCNHVIISHKHEDYCIKIDCSIHEACVVLLPMWLVIISNSCYSLHVKLQVFNVSILVLWNAGSTINFSNHSYVFKQTCDFLPYDDHTGNQKQQQTLLCHVFTIFRGANEEIERSSGT